MPKLPVVTPAKLIKVLENIWFVYVFGSGSHRVMKHVDGEMYHDTNAL
jgi:predicted RNA binding protein YcfA (HicA-like mRNA interferase family)